MLQTTKNIKITGKHVDWTRCDGNFIPKRAFVVNIGLLR